MDENMEVMKKLGQLEKKMQSLGTNIEGKNLMDNSSISQLLEMKNQIQETKKNLKSDNYRKERYLSNNRY